MSLVLVLQGERQISALIGISVAFAAHVVGVYWWFRKDDLLYPLIMFPPKSIPPFWHAIFIIFVNGVCTQTLIFFFNLITKYINITMLHACFIILCLHNLHILPQIHLYGRPQ